MTGALSVRFAGQSGKSGQIRVRCFSLAEASHFRHAWQTGDLENGMVGLNDGIRQSEECRQTGRFFSKATNRAFEITRGHRHQDKYKFRSCWRSFDVPTSPVDFPK
jgi:hypothetical protein